MQKLYPKKKTNIKLPQLEPLQEMKTGTEEKVNPLIVYEADKTIRGQRYEVTYNETKRVVPTMTTE